MQYVSKLNKQNFDLKLELFHRRQRTGTLEVKLNALEAKLDASEADKKELQGINEELLRALESRDEAVREAVGLLYDWEVKMDEMKRFVADLQASTTTPGLESQLLSKSSEPSEQPLAQVDDALPSTPFTTRMSDHQKDSQGARSPRDKSTPGVEKAPCRMPSFLMENKKSTQALRSLYASDGGSSPGNLSVFSLPRPGSLFSADEKPEADSDGFMLNSPRLSMLSESSFRSVYGKAKGSDQISAKHKERRPYDESSSEDERPLQDSKQHNPNIHKWMSESKITPTRRRFAKDRRGDHFSSIDEVVDDIPNEVQTVQRARQMSPRSPSRQKREETVNFQPLPALGGTMFGHDILPPTPDTMSTANIEANSNAPSIITEKSLRDGAPFGANHHRAFALEGRPQTAESSSDPKLDPASIFDEEDTVIKSDGEHESTQVALSDAGTVGNPQLPHQGSTFMTGSLNAKRKVSALPVRPLLTSYATDMMFNGEGYGSVQPARTMSYPSPPEGKNRRSVQFPPAGHEASEVSKIVNDSHSTKSRAGGRNAMVTPTRERFGTSPTESLSDGRGAESWTQSETENSDRRRSASLHSSSLRIRSLFGKRTSPSAKSGPALSDSPLSNLQSNTTPPTSRHRRPSSIHLQNSSKPLPEPPASRIARPSSAKDPAHGQFGTARRYSNITDATASLMAHGVNPSKPDSGEDSVELARGADLPFGRASTGGVVHRRVDSESQQNNRIMGGDEAIGVAGRKWGIGVGRSTSTKVKEAWGMKEGWMKNRQK